MPKGFQPTALALAETARVNDYAIAHEGWAWSARGGNTTAERYGREHYIRAAHKRWGRLEGGTSNEA